MGSVRRVLLIFVIAAAIAILGGRLYVHRQLAELQRQLDEAQSQLQVALDKSDAVKDKQMVEVANDIASIRSQLDKDIPADLQTQYQDLVQRIAALALSSSADTSSSAKDLLARLTNSAGTGIAVSGPNSVTISNTGVLSVNGGNGAVTIKGTANQVSVGGSGSTIHLGLPQDIAASSSPRFASLTVSGALGAASLSGDGSSVTNVDALTLQGNSASYFTNASNLNAGTIADARLSSNVALLDAANTFTAGQAIQTGAVGTNGLVIQGVASQTANLTEWRDSVGTVLSEVDATGRLGLGVATPTRTLDVNGNAKFSNAAGKNIYTGQFEASGLFGNANSLSTGSSSGDLILAGGGPSNPGGAIVLDGGGTGSGDVAKGIGFYAGPNVGSFPALMMSLTSGGVLRVASTGTPGTVEKFRVNTPTTVDNAAATVLSTGGAANKALVVQGAASQSANPFEIQNSSGTAIAYATSSGSLVSAGSVSASTFLQVGTNPAGTGALRFSNDANIKFRNAANSADVSVLRLDSTDILRLSPDGYRVNSVAPLSVNSSGTLGTVEKFRVNAPTTVDNSATVMITTTSLSSKGVVIQASSGQTGRLMSFQDTSGNDLAFFNAAGRLGLNASTSGLGSSAKLAVNNHATVDNNADVMFTAGSATSKPLVVQGATSQTANLQEWQNSSGTALARVRSDGTIDANGGGSSGVALGVQPSGANVYGILAIAQASPTKPVAEFRGGANSSNDPTVLIKAGSSQSANLQEWQSSTGTVLASLDANGNLSVKAATVSGNLTVNGHYISGNTSGSTTIAAGAAAGASPTVSISGNDTAGTITVTTGGSGVSTGTLATITFANAYGAAPRVLFTAKTSAGAALQLYNSTATGSFTINTGVAPSPGTTYTFDYHVIQ